jgi:RNA polymerase sigma factor (sigma-70 family)
MQSTDDRALLRQYAESNSDEAFAALVARHINLVYSVALRQVGNPHHAEEITQAVFVILAKKAAQLRHDKALSSWLFQVTRLTANNFVRSEIRRQHREQEAYMETILNESGTEVWPRIAPLLDNAVANLNEKDRRAIVLRFYEGRNLQEVGAALGASEEAAKKRVNRAVEKLQKFFFKRGVASTTAIIAGAISANSVQAAPAALGKTVAAVAIIKGATASASTSTLIKGALKIMAWTKAKTAIIAGTVLVLTSATTIITIKEIESRHSQTQVGPKVTDLGIILADGKSSSHVLADGRTCVLTPTILPGGHQIQLVASVRDTNAAGVRHVQSLTSYFAPDLVTIFEFDSNNIISLTLHIP